MNQDELIAEIERRKQRAADLKVRETLWCLYQRHFKLYPQWALRDPELIYGGFENGSPEVSDKDVKFSIGSDEYRLSCREQVPRDCSRERTDVKTKKDGTLALEVNGQRVFKFEWSQATEYLEDGPVFTDRLGDITRFIDGLWVLEITDLLVRIVDHEKSIHDRRNAGRLETLKKRFGL